jgi:hypothetical protein
MNRHVEKNAVKIRDENLIIEVLAEETGDVQFDVGILKWIER